jgi:hypothetical protein
LLIYLIINGDLTDMITIIKAKSVSKYFPWKSTLSRKTRLHRQKSGNFILIHYYYLLCNFCSYFINNSVICH